MGARRLYLIFLEAKAVYEIRNRVVHLISSLLGKQNTAISTGALNVFLMKFLIRKDNRCLT